VRKKKKKGWRTVRIQLLILMEILMATRMATHMATRMAIHMEVSMLVHTCMVKVDMVISHS
jgi:hypothetical protein